MYTDIHTAAKVVTKVKVVTNVVRVVTKTVTKPVFADNITDMSVLADFNNINLMLNKYADTINADRVENINDKVTDIQLLHNASVQDFIKNSFCLTADDAKWKQFCAIFKHYFGEIPHRFYGFVDNDIAKIPAQRCTLGHGALIRMAKALNMPYITIFEDDAYPRYDVVDQLSKCIKLIPSDAKIVLWGNVTTAIYDNCDRCKKINDNLYEITKMIGGSHSYTIFRSAYDEYLSMYPKLADLYWPAIHTYAVNPILFIQCNMIRSAISRIIGYNPHGGTTKDDVHIPPDGFKKIDSILK